MTKWRFFYLDSQGKGRWVTVPAVSYLWAKEKLERSGRFPVGQGVPV